MLNLLIRLLFLTGTFNHSDGISGRVTSGGDKTIAIFRSIPNHSNGSDVTAIALINSKVYYFKNHISLKLGEKISIKEGMIIRDESLKKMLEALTVNELEKLEAKNCDCHGITENIFVVDFFRNGNRRVVIDEVTDCPQNSNFKVIEKIRNYFLSFAKYK